VAAILLLATLVSRLPFRTHYLSTWDSANFALGLRRLDFEASQPHPPGYILYEAAGRVISIVLTNPNTALVALSIGSTALAAVLLLYAGRAYRNTATGAVAAIVVLASPLAWYYGEVALAYTTGMAAASAIVGAAALAWRDSRWLPVLWLIGGLTAGIRPDVAAFHSLLVIALTVQAARRRAWAPIGLSAIVTAAAMAVWLVPDAIVSHGLGPYLTMVKAEQQTGQLVVTPLAHPERIPSAALRLGIVLILALGGFTPALALLAVRALRANAGRLFVSAFLVALPACGYWGLVNLDRIGYVLALLPSLALVVAVPLATMWGRGVSYRRLAVGLTGVAALAGTAFFLLPTRADFPGAQLAGPDAGVSQIPRRSMLRASDRTWRDLIALVTSRGTPGTVAVVNYLGADNYSYWRDLAVDLPRYANAFAILDRPERGVYTIRCDRTTFVHGIDVDIGSATRVVLLGASADVAPPGRDPRWRAVARDADVAEFPASDPPIPLGAYRIVHGPGIDAGCAG
jgi:hypothetical protein